MTDKQVITPSEDEFDIEVLAAKLWRIQKKFWIKMFYPARVLVSNPIRAGIYLAIALAVSLTLRYTLTPVYKTTFIIRPNNPTDYFYSGMIDDLNLLLKDDNKEEVARALGLDVETADYLVKISGEKFYKSEFRKDTVSSYEITMILQKPALTDTFTNHILHHYLEGSPFYQKSRNVQQQEITDLEFRLEKDIRENDSLKKVILLNSFPRGNGGFVYGEPIDPVKVHEAGLILYQKLMRIRAQKQYLDNFELVKPAIMRKKPYFPRMIILFPILGSIALLFCFIRNLKDIQIQNNR